MEISHAEQSRQFGQWLLDKGTLLLAWRLGILLAIFLIWPFIIRYRVKDKIISPAAVKQLIDNRYTIIFSMLVIDIIIHLF